MGRIVRGSRVAGRTPRSCRLPSADLLLQGHIFFPGPVEEDVDPDSGANEAAVIKGVVCSEELHKLLNGKGRK
jgi:hypothetical protein